LKITIFMRSASLRPAQRVRDLVARTLGQAHISEKHNTCLFMTRKLHGRLEKLYFRLYNIPLSSIALILTRRG